MSKPKETVVDKGNRAEERRAQRSIFRKKERNASTGERRSGNATTYSLDNSSISIEIAAENSSHASFVEARVVEVPAVVHAQPIVPPQSPGANESPPETLVHPRKDRKWKYFCAALVLSLIVPAVILGVFLGRGSDGGNGLSGLSAGAKQIEGILDQTKTQGSNLYNYCRQEGLGDKDPLRLFYETSEKPVRMMACLHNVSLEDRLLYETKDQIFYAEHYPQIDYVGFKGSNGVVPWSEQPFYMVPLQFLEPVTGNEILVGFDFYSQYPGEIDAAMTQKEPQISRRLYSILGDGYVVLLFHAGGIPYEFPGLSLMALSMTDILTLALKKAERTEHSVSLYLFDSLLDDKGARTFLGGVQRVPLVNGYDAYNSLAEMTYQEATTTGLQHQDVIRVASRDWFVVSVR